MEKSLSQPQPLPSSLSQRVQLSPARKTRQPLVARALEKPDRISKVIQKRGERIAEPPELLGGQAAKQVIIHSLPFWANTGHQSFSATGQAQKYTAPVLRVRSLFNQAGLL